MEIIKLRYYGAHNEGWPLDQPPLLFALLVWAVSTSAAYYYYLKLQTEMIKSRITENSVIKHIMECSSKTSKTALSMPETRESRFRGSLKIIIRFRSTNTDTNINEHTQIQIYNYTITQLHKYTNTQIHNYIFTSLMSTLATAPRATMRPRVTLGQT